MTRGPKRKDLTGETFGRLTVIRFSHQNGRRNMWLCECDCGNEVLVRGDSLRTGHTTSCGCYHREYKRTNQTHGMWNTPEYARWRNMMERCYNSNNPRYERYGGRGIKVCDRWLGTHGFENFFTDMGPRPSPEHTIDRYPDNDGDYEPSNCRWATYTEQNRNFSRNHLITFNDKTQPMSAWAEETGLPYSVISWRIRNEWSVERALTEPVNENHSH